MRPDRDSERPYSSPTGHETCTSVQSGPPVVGRRPGEACPLVPAIGNRDRPSYRPPDPPPPPPARKEPAGGRRRLRRAFPADPEVRSRDHPHLRRPAVEGRRDARRADELFL